MSYLQLNEEVIKMFTAKKYFYFISTVCFLTTSLSFQYLWAKEELKKTPSIQEKDESKQKKASAQNQPQISLDSTHYDVGEVYEGDELIHSFIVKNTGKADLNIKSVKAG